MGLFRNLDLRVTSEIPIVSDNNSYVLFLFDLTGNSPFAKYFWGHQAWLGTKRLT